jgi:hypothetical protein
MKTTLIAVILLAAFAAACHERKTDPAPDYDSIRAHSRAAQGALGAPGEGE